MGERADAVSRAMVETGMIATREGMSAVYVMTAKECG